MQSSELTYIETKACCGQKVWIVQLEGKNVGKITEYGPNDYHWLALRGHNAGNETSLNDAKENLTKALRAMEVLV